MIGYTVAVILAQENHILFRSDKVWTVLAVLLVIWLAVLALLLRLDRRLTRLEKQIDDHTRTR